MLCRMILATVIGAALLPSAASAGLIVFQGFEEGEAENFAANPAAYINARPPESDLPNVSRDSTDVWSPIRSFTGARAIAANGGDRFWGMQGLGPNVENVLSFDRLDLTGYRNVRVSFHYNVAGLDQGEQLFFAVNGGERVEVGGGSPGASENRSSGGWQLREIDIADSVDSLAFDLIANGSGSGDRAGWDDITITGDAIAAVPEPGSLVLLGLAAAGGLAGRRRKSSRSDRPGRGGRGRDAGVR